MAMALHSNTHGMKMHVPDPESCSTTRAITFHDGQAVDTHPIHHVLPPCHLVWALPKINLRQSKLIRLRIKIKKRDDWDFGRIKILP